MPLRIRDIREDHNLRQEDIAQLLHVSQATYSRFEKEDIEIPHKAFSVLADFYQTSVDYLLGRTNQKKAYPKV